jgi:hypothetical protein
MGCSPHQGINESSRRLLNETFAETDIHHDPLIWEAWHFDFPSTPAHLGSKPVLHNWDME